MTILLAVDTNLLHDFPEINGWEPRARCGYVGRAPQLLFPHGECCTYCSGCASLPVATASPGGRAQTSTGPERSLPPAAGPVGFQ